MWLMRSLEEIFGGGKFGVSVITPQERDQLDKLNTEYQENFANIQGR